MSNLSSTRGYGVLEKLLARRRAHIADSLISNSLRSGKILDIGCGSFPLFLANISFKEKYGLDKISPPLQLEKNQTPIIRINQDIELNPHLPFPEDNFSIVAALAMIEHADSELAQKLIREIYRVLEPRGLCIMTTPAHWTNILLRILAKIRLVSPIEINDHKNLYSPDDLRTFLRTAGFEDKKISSGHFELGLNLWLAAEK